MKIVNTYIDNVAAASGMNDNVYSTNTEYSLINYRIHAASPMVDRHAFKSGGCTPTAGYQACVSQDQLLAELASFVTDNKLPTGLAHYYPLFFPSGVQVAARWGSAEEKSGVDFCAYHDSTKTATGKTVVLAVEPFGNICSSGQMPNGDKAADTQIDTLSHEILESISDPVKPSAWRDGAGAENADMCNGNYGPPLGSTDPAHPATTRYNQVINGAKYYTQTNFSNLSYLVSPFGGCVQNKAQVDSRLLGKQSGTSPNTLTVHATSYRMPADGSATSMITATVVDRNGRPVAGDDVVFRVASGRGTHGSCGSLDPVTGTVSTTNADGVVTVRYKASATSLACDVVAIEGATGQSDQALIDQGTLDQTAPTITATLPESVTAGGPAVTFTATITNPSGFAVRNARVGITVTGDKSASQGVNASQLHLSFADRSTNGQYTQVRLIGSTAVGGEITGVLPPNTGSNFPAGATKTITFKLSVDRGAVPSTKTSTTLHLTTDFDQVNLASGSTTTLDSSVASTKVHAA
jgi:hypothetical protein